MFYIWLLSSSFFTLSLLCQVTLFSVGIFPNLMNIFMTLALEITTASLMVKKLKEPHKASYSLKAVGLWFSYYGFFMLVTSNRMLFSPRIALRIEFALLLIAIGILIFYYNKKGKIQVSESEIRLLNGNQDEEPEDKLFNLVFEIESLLALEEVEQNKEFSQDLEDIEELIQILESKNIRISPVLVDQVIEVFAGYNKLMNEPVLTLEIIEKLIKVEQLTKRIKTAFQIEYRKVILEEVDELDTQIDVLSNQLQLSGLTQSDFEIFN